MIDLVCRAIERFLSAECGLDGATGLSPDDVLQDAARRLHKPFDELAEDLGAWLVRQTEIWRLLRFCGSDFLEFLLHLDELPDRIRLIIEDAQVPEISLSRSGDGLIWVSLSDNPPIWTALFTGLLRGMADDYGTLCVITRDPDGICIDVSDSAFAVARTFRLSPKAITA